MEKISEFRFHLFRKLGPIRVVVLSILFVILMGTLLLLLPISSVNGQAASLVDTLFIATTASCVTGLIPFAVVDQYTRFGQCVIIVLMQLGGLGIMTIIFCLLTLIKKKLLYNEKQILHESLNTKDLNQLPIYIRKILLYTFIFELIGFLLYATVLVPDHGMENGLFSSLFLTVSAFCNAGIDNLFSDSLATYALNPIINFTTMGLITLGGLGFAVWFNLFDSIVNAIKKKRSMKLFLNSLSTHTKMVISISGMLIVTGAVFILLFEWNNPATLGTYSFGNKIMAALFQSITLRTAGFSTINFSSLNLATLFVMLFYMLIGGSSGSTAGGIKTTTFCVLILACKAALHDSDDMVFHKRTIARAVFNRAFAILTVYLTALTVAVLILSVTENFDFMALVFECISAIATVGLSVGITAQLSVIGKLVIIMLMMIGRIGPVTVVLSLLRRTSSRKSSQVRYPEGEIMIG